MAAGCQVAIPARERSKPITTAMLDTTMTTAQRSVVMMGAVQMASQCAPHQVLIPLIRRLNTRLLSNFIEICDIKMLIACHHLVSPWMCNSPRESSLPLLSLCNKIMLNELVLSLYSVCS